MRKIYSLLLALALFSAANLYAQVDVTATGGTLAASYGSLKGAFDAINAGTHTGTIGIGISGNPTEGTASIVLNASGSGLASYTSILIQPTGGAARTITAATTAGNPMIDLNGADNVTIDGLNTGGNSLTISNTTASATSGTSTIRFVGGATNNTITNCTLRGSVSSSVATNGATIFFSTDGVTANGNDNNTISNNDIGPAGSNLPTKAILGNGSTTTTAIGNSGNIINNNNIFDYFGAAVTSSGIATNGGCNAWTITNNRFYQTATRTWTTGAIHRAIDINNATATSGAQGFTITGNIIGYASSTQTGVYTLTGSTGKFHGINFNGFDLGTVSNINNNTVASVSLTGVTSNGTSTSSPLVGILISSGVATTNNNTIGSQSATGSLVFSTNTTTATDIYGLYNFSDDVWTANSNNIGGISVTNAGASGTFLVYGMRANTGTGVTWTAGSNNVGGTVANSIQLTGTGVSSQVVGMLSSNAPMVFTSNTVRNLTTNIGTGTTTSASVIGICHTSTTPVNSISQSIIHTLTNTNATAASVVTGIQFTGSTGANLVERNLIYNLNVSTNAAGAEVNGIRVGGGTTTYRNNMIALGANVANAIGGAAGNGTTAGINGINGALGTDNFYHNSVYIGGTATAGSGASYAFNGTQTTNTRSFRDNIFFNARTNSGATGKHYAVKINGTAPNPTGLTINNNVYFANGTGAVFGFFNSADVANLAAWKAAVGQDASSFEGNPQYLDPTNATPDLHINPSITTAAEGNGVDLGVVLDYDGQTRSGLTPVDIGADAGNFTGADLSAPVITYTPLSNTCTLTGVTLTATISDAGSGVPTSGAGLPVLYWRVNAGAYAVLQGSHVSGNTYSFGPFGNGSVGDVISYFIVAQDLAATPNVTASPAAGAGGFTATPPAATTPPTTPSSFALQNSIGGTYTVGSGGDYATITAAVAAYNTSCLTNAVVFNLIDASYTGETFPITINANSFANATNTLTIKTTQASTTITGSSASALFVLNGADYVTIDGSVSATANTVCPASAASRDLTITNTSTSTTSAVIWLQTTAGLDAATNNTIRNINLVGNSNTTTLFGAGSGSATISTGSLGTGNNNNSFVNNNISKTQVGIFSQGASAANKNTGTVINQNLINTASPNNVATNGIRVGFENNITISGNNIDNLQAPASTDGIAIALGNNAVATSTFTGNEVTNASVTNNIIGVVRSASTFSAVGIYLTTTTNTGTTLIANNMISGVNSNGTSGDLAAGIFIGGVTGTVNVFYNTVTMVGTLTGGSYPSFGFASGSSTPVLNIRNNIFTSTGSTGANLNRAMGFGYSTFTNVTSDNNDLFASGTGAAVVQTVNLTNSGSTSYTTVTGAGSWNAASSKDANSKNVLPVFISSTDLHLDNNSNPLLDGGAAVVSVTNDIDCETRNASTPDIGADEFAAPNCTGATGGTASGDATFCGSGTPTITATGFSSGTTTIYQWYSSTNIGDYPNAGTAVSGQTNPATLTTGVVSTTTYYWLRVECTAASATDNSTLVTITVNPNPTAPVTPTGPVTICTPATQLLDGSGTNAASPIYQWRNNGSDISGETNATFTASATGSYTVRVEDGVTGCFTISTAVAVTVNQTPDAVVITPLSATICEGGSVALSASGGNIPAINDAFEASSGAINLAIPDNLSTGTSNTIAVSGIPGGVTIDSVIVTFNIDHEFAGDAEVNLQAPNGQIINLMADRGGSSTLGFVDTRVTSDVTKPAFSSGSNPFTGTFRADGTTQGNLIGSPAVTTSTFSNLFSVANGNWTIRAYDDANGDVSTLNDWSIKISYSAAGQPASFVWTPAASGLDVYTGPNVTASPATTTTYTATSTVNGCPSFSTVEVTVNPNYDIVASSGANGTVTPAGTTTLSCDGTGDQTYTITPDPGYVISDLIVDGVSATPLTTGTYAAGGTYDFINVTANHTISATFAVACVNVGITSVTASNPGPLCSGQTTNLTANGVVGTNAVVTWWTGPNGTGTNLGTGTTLNNVGANTYYARVTGDCGTPAEASITINSTGNIFTGTGNWSDNARWSCGAPPASGDAVTIASGANATLDVNFTVSGSLTMDATSTLIVNPTRTLAVDVAATANFNGQSVTFLSDATGTASLGQVNGTLSGATNVTVERYIPNNGFRSWRLLSVPVTTSQTIRQAWQEGDANPLPQQNNLVDRGTQITGVFGTQAAAAAAGFDSTSVQAGMLRWNGTGWSNITSTNQSINNFSSYFLYIRGERSRTVTGSVTNASATTLRTKGTVFTGDQTTNVGANAFALIPNRYPSAINFTGLTRTGGVNNLFYIWDSKKLNGQSLGAYQTFSGTNGFICLLSGGSYTLGQPNTTIESGQSFFVTSSTAGTIVLKESAKISGTNGNLGFRPAPSVIKSKIDTRLYNHLHEMLDANAVVFDAVYSKTVADEDAPKFGNPGANFAIETGSKLLAIEGTSPVKENDAIQFRMWNLAAGNYQLEFAMSNMSLPAGTSAILEDSYLNTKTVLNNSAATSVTFTVDANAASSAANRFRVVIAKPGALYGEAGFTIAPNPIETGVMNVVFSKQVAGKYSVRIVSAAGQVLSTYRLTHAGGSANQSVTLPALMGNGTYTVEIVSPDKSRTVKTVLVNRK